MSDVAQRRDGTRAAVLRSDRLWKRYSKRFVVRDVTIEVRQGEVVGLLGPNGAGKTTTFHMIVGMVPPTEGRVFLDELEITAIPMYQRSRMGIGYLPQEASVFRRLTVRENVLAVLQMMDLSEDERRE
ncbi:MAG TPA: ATP-binding cassette domain-containing protein, partial [Bacteroidota bacterium]